MILYDTDEEWHELPESKIDELIKYDKNIGGFNEAYDEFVTRIFLEDGVVHFLLKLITDEERLESLYKGCDLDIVHKKVDFIFFTQVMNQFREVLIKENVLKS